MALGYLTLFTALIISLSSAVYSILGLTAIFAAAFWPIVILGGSLEFGKIVTTLWLHKYWDRAEIQYKVYLCSAVAILMLLTSMGVFGFLSKAHLDQAVPSGDVAAKVQIFDDKIKTQRDNIDAARKALTQMDSVVDQTMSRSTSEQGADKSAALRRSQAKERTALQNDISKAQKEITVLQEQRAPIASEMRKVEAEVGPIKYIAALVYGDNPEANTLEKAVRWVIILIVIVFDPLALTLLLAATKSIEWEHGIDIFAPKKKDDDEEEETKIEADEGDLTPEQIEQLNRTLADSKEEQPEEDISHWNDFFNGSKSFQEVERSPQIDVVREKLEPDPLPIKVSKDPTEPGWMFTKSTGDVTAPKHFGIKDEEKIIEEIAELVAEETLQATEPVKPVAPVIPEDPLAAMAKSIVDAGHPVEHIEALPLSDSERKRLREQYAAHAEAVPQADNTPPENGNVTGFGTEFPATANKGDMFLRVDQLPSVLYKYNGKDWIKVNKNLSDNYLYDDAYIDYLIEKIGSGEYDPDLLSDLEKERIAEKLKTTLPPQG